jgi:DNA polymerase
VDGRLGSVAEGGFLSELIYCFADTETGSELDLKTYGTPRYAEHESTFVQLFSYSLYEGHMGLWDLYCGEPMPLDLKDAIENPNVIFVFWNRFFDASVLKHRTDIHIPLRRTRCAMAQAMSHGLPGSLEKVGEIVGIREDARKLKEGKQLVQFFCKPKKHKDGRLEWHRPLDYPEKWQRYKEYCMNDTLAMREIVKKLPHWNYSYCGRGNPVELEYWFMDQECNERGMPIDIALAEAAVRAVDKEQKLLAAKTRQMTRDTVQAASQRDAMLKFVLEEYGVELPNMQKATLERLVENNETPPEIRELLEVRLSTCTTSTAKYKKLLQVVSSDGRFRGGVKYYGASRTGRDSGSNGFQCQNATKPSIYPRDPEFGHQVILQGIDCLKVDAADIAGFDVMELCSSAVRYCIAAPEGFKFCIADLSNIEGRVITWLAGEAWKLQAFRDFDAGKGHDLYKIAYAKSFGIKPEEVTKQQRNTVGKVLELSMGFGGGVGGMLVFINMYNVNLPELVVKAKPAIPIEVYREAESFYDWMRDQDVADAKKEAEKEQCPEDWEQFYTPRRTYKLDKETFATLDSLKRLWRAAHPKIVDFWADAENACRSAVMVPNRRFAFGNNCFAERKGKWTRIVLPSGHSVPYPDMQIDADGSLSFMGVHQFTKKFTRIKTSKGKLSENCTQALAADIFKHGRLLAHNEGYPCVLPLHDEQVCEVSDTPDYTVTRLEELMATVPDFCPDLPLAAKGFESSRYHKSLD